MQSTPLDSFATPVASLPRERSKNQDEGDALVRPPELTLVIPTYNERDNIEALLELLDQALEGESREYLFVDDNSPDGTADEVRRLGRDRSDVRVIERIGKRGLASACAAFRSATTPTGARRRRGVHRFQSPNLWWEGARRRRSAHGRRR